MERFVPLAIAGAAVVIAVLVAYIIPEGFGPPLQSSGNLIVLPEMTILMIGIIIAGFVIVGYGVMKVVKPFPGQVSEAFGLILAGIILFMGVTILDLNIHAGELSFNRLTHFLWHFVELVGIVFLGMGFKKLATIVTVRQA